MSTRRAWSTMAGLAAAALLLVPTASVAGGGKHACSVDKLNGLYVFTASGVNLTLGPKAIIELIRFNGDGTVEVAGGTIVVNGTKTAIPSGGAGTYTVNDLTPPDDMCAGTLSFPHGATNFDIFLAPDAKKVRMIQTDSGNVFEGTAARVSH